MGPACVAPGMKQQALTFTAIALLGLAACGSPETEETPAPANGQDGATRESGSGNAADNGAVEDLLDHVAAANDDSFEPEVETVAGDNLQLDGPLAEGSWSSAGVGGMEYGQEAMAPVAGLRCASDGSALIVSVPLPPDLSEMGEESDSALSAPPPGEDGDGESETAEETPAETRTGSLITANGTVTGTFRPAETRDEWREMTISADEAVLDGLPRDGRIGVGLEGEQSRLMPVTGALIASLETCVDAAPAPSGEDASESDGDDGTDDGDGEDDNG